MLFVLSPYLTCAMSPTTISDTLIWIICPPRTTVNFCSCSMRLWRPRNCFSLLQSLKAVTKTTHTTDNRMAAPSIHPASPSPSSSTPPAALPQSEQRQHRLCFLNVFKQCSLTGSDLWPFLYRRIQVSKAKSLSNFGRTWHTASVMQKP